MPALGQVVDPTTVADVVEGADPAHRLPPAETRARVVAQVHEIQGVSIRHATLMTAAEPVWIDEPVLLHMAGAAGGRVAGGEAGVIEEHPAERRSSVRDAIVPGCVVERFGG